MSPSTNGKFSFTMTLQFNTKVPPQGLITLAVRIKIEEQPAAKVKGGNIVTDGARGAVVAELETAACLIAARVCGVVIAHTFACQ